MHCHIVCRVFLSGEQAAVPGVFVEFESSRLHSLSNLPFKGKEIMPYVYCILSCYSCKIRSPPLPRQEKYNGIFTSRCFVSLFDCTVSILSIQLGFSVFIGVGSRCLHTWLASDTSLNFAAVLFLSFLKAAIFQCLYLFCGGVLVQGWFSWVLW